MTAYQLETFRVEQSLAWSKARQAEKDGVLIVPEQCPKCGKPAKLEGHHPDYAKPLKVVFLCRKCHSALHAKLRAKARRVKL
ncbi:MAG: hypothetical protein WC455_25965 [Dehalococcoidia bacterium]|jgi:transposase-like protein